VVLQEVEDGIIQSSVTDTILNMRALNEKVTEVEYDRIVQ